MEIWEKSLGDVCIVGISGRMDSLNSKDIEAKMNLLIENDTAKIIIDLADVDYISSVGLRVLLAALKKQKQKQGSIKLVSLQPFVSDIFKMTGFDKIFSIYSNQEAALERYAYSI
jgi:anti-sigma B factor antagonist